MKKHQITALLLALTLGLSLCACGDDTKNPADTSTSDTSADKSGSDELTLNLPDDLYYEDHTVTYLALEKYTNYFKLITAEDTKGDVLEEAGYKRALAVSELLGVEFDKYETMDIVPTLNSAIMSDEDTFDFVLPHCQAGPAALVSGGLLLDWAELDYVDFSKPWWNRSMQDTVSVAGKTFFAAGDITMTWQGMGAIIFNKEYLETYKIDEDLYQIVYDGEWTLDKMFELATGVAKNLDGGDKMDEKDQYGLLLNSDGGASLQLSAGIPFTKLDDDGCPVLAMNTEKMYNLVEKYYEITHSPDTFLGAYGSTSWPTSVYRDIFMSGRSFLTSLDVGGLYTSLREVNYEFGLLPHPKYDEQQEDYLSACAAGIIGVPVNADPERTGAIAEALAYYSYVYVRPAFFDVVLQNKALRDEDSYNMLTMMHEGKVYDFAYNFAPAAANIMDAVVIKSNNTDFASYYASQEDALNITIREIYDAVVANSDN